MDNEKVPEWAKARVVELINATSSQPNVRAIEVDWTDRYLSVPLAFARYIAEHEEPPVDLLLIEAREIASTIRPAFADDFRSGAVDATSTEVPVALAALRRGMELARKEDSHAG